MTEKRYTGRFAPSPTGDPHLGTLIAAVASYLQARVNHGDWLLRIEDVDTTRRVAGAEDAMLRTLDRFGFEWDGDVIRQSARTAIYQQALDQLDAEDLVFPCTCSRKLLAQTAVEQSGIYPGTCRTRQLPFAHEHAIRLRVPERTLGFDDRIIGEYRQSLATECGDFVIKRRDGLFAYQLAVVVDDALQGVTEVVRGADLLESTPRQIYLQQCLNHPSPAYCHIPLILDPTGRKLSKSEGAAGLNPDRPAPSLLAALNHLGQQAPEELGHAGTTDIWQWAIENWDIGKIPLAHATLYNG
ncbi:MAG: tRNA glutamyl-Q(34) synthetase GluQRS [Thiotrichales bacterium]|nr:MAG: tRNA glutamyl-Q(34) synthetase GluQRS [Thiotrichales bacterium]